MKNKLIIKDTPQKNEEEIIESFDKNEDKNVEIEEDTEMGDISSNLEGYPGSKDETRKNDVEENLDKNEESDNIGNEENQGRET